ncbi:ArnT family glycosyltransferase [Limisalsivibrio acetivorans]|uniref:ArnT family glycosyltransferase n=1 Tax=Limisalsivibrio acetivorans TaxID=1304888 RepID=UPI0003B61CB2|nr:glycosyltransferase family 39 protein [Limisalsivibrio acetivorans]
MDLNRGRVFLLICVAAFSFLYGIFTVPLFDLDEGAFSEATREMIRSGNYLTTYLEGKLRFDKPILIYWFQALFANIFGIHEFVFRFPSVISASIWLTLVYLFTKRYYGEVRAFWAGIVMSCSLLVTIVAKLAIADALLNMTLAASMFSIFLYRDTGDKRFIYTAHAAIGLGILTKGPVAILIPFAVSFLFFLSVKDLKKWLVAVFNPMGLALMIGIAAPWYVMEYIDQGMNFINGFIFKHNIGRFSDPMEGHVGGIGYYVPVIIVSLMPFSTLLYNMFRRVKEIWSTELERYMLIWFLFVFLFFSFSGTKLPHYVLYGMTPLFILISKMFIDAKNPLAFTIPILLFLLIMLGIPLYLPPFIAGVEDEFARAVAGAMIDRMEIFYFATVGAMTVFTFVSLFIRRISIRTRGVVFGIFMLFCANVLLMPILGEARQRGVKEAAIYAKERGIRVNTWGSRMPSFSVYYDDIPGKEYPRPGEYFFTKVDKLDKINYPYEVIKEWPAYRLVRIEEME